MGLCRFFHETWQFFKDLELAVIEDSENPKPPHLCKPELNHTTESIGNLIIIVGIHSHFV